MQSEVNSMDTLQNQLKGCLAKLKELECEGYLSIPHEKLEEWNALRSMMTRLSQSRLMVLASLCTNFPRTVYKKGSEADRLLKYVDFILEPKPPYWVHNDILHYVCLDSNKESICFSYVVGEEEGLDVLEYIHVPIRWLLLSDVDELRKIRDEIEEQKETLETAKTEMLVEEHKDPRPSWDEYFIRLAKDVATRSNCSRRHVGAVIVKDNHIIATGYNGTPAKTTNCFDGGCPRCSGVHKTGEKLDECLCVHAEQNAICQSAKYGNSIDGGTIYITCSPCLTCLKLIINSGIRRIVFAEWYREFNEQENRLIEEAGIEWSLFKKGENK